MKYINYPNVGLYDINSLIALFVSVSDVKSFDVDGVTISSFTFINLKKGAFKIISFV